MAAENYTYPAKNNFEQEEGNLFSELIYKYLPWWPLFIILMMIAGAAAWVYLRYTVPVYESTATILIKDDKKGGGLNDSKILQSLDVFGSKKIVENEIEVLHSRTLAKEVVKKLGLYAPVKSMGRFSDRSGYVTSPIAVQVPSPDSLLPVKKVLFALDRSGHVVMNNRAYPLDEWVKTPFGVLKFTANKNYLRQAEPRAFYFSLLPVKTAAADLLGRLKVNASSKMSTVLNLTLSDEVPKRGENVINEWIDAYNRASIEDKNKLAANTLAFVEDRLKLVTNELTAVESQLQQYKTSNHIVDISAQGQQFLQQVGENDQKVGQMNIQLSALDEVEKYVSSRQEKGAIVPSTFGIADQVLNGLLQKLYESQLQYERLKTTTAENDPAMIAVVDQISRLKPSILENIRSQRRSIEAGRGDVYASNNKFTSILSTIPTKERELLEISRQQSIKNGIYTFLLQKREETALDYASEVADSRTVDQAESYGPVSPKVPLTYLIAMVAAIVLGVGFIGVKEVINRNVLFSSEIEKYTSRPILGEIAHDESHKTLVVGEGKRSLVAEQFRQVRTSLGYLGVNSRKKKILVTSSISGEGKSFITANLGESLALMGKKVVLLELDLRKPKLSAAFGVDRSVGLSNYFIGDKEADEIIKRTQYNDNLFIIPSGPLPPNPSELIVNGRLEELFAYLEESFDYIITDTAPISPVTDAYIISPLCDATLFIVRHGVTPRAFIKRLDEHLVTRPLQNMAIVFNGVKGRGFGKYGYGYGYGNGYGYGYEYAYGDEKKAKKKRSFNLKIW